MKPEPFKNKQKKDFLLDDAQPREDKLGYSNLDFFEKEKLEDILNGLMSLSE